MFVSTTTTAHQRTNGQACAGAQWALALPRRDSLPLESGHHGVGRRWSQAPVGLVRVFAAGRIQKVLKVYD